MIGVIVAVVVNTIGLLGWWAYDDYTTEQKIDMCVEETLKQHPKLNKNDVYVACKNVIE